jgi:hypothetical protein
MRLEPTGLSGRLLPDPTPRIDDVRMTTGIIHQQRLAWDCARVLAEAADTDQLYFWVGARLRELLGAEHEWMLSQSRTRLLVEARPDQRQVESGLWRARLEDVLRERPELSIALSLLTDDIRARLGSPFD